MMDFSAMTTCASQVLVCVTARKIVSTMKTNQWRPAVRMLPTLMYFFLCIALRYMKTKSIYQKVGEPVPDDYIRHNNQAKILAINQCETYMNSSIYKFWAAGELKLLRKV